MKASGLKYFLVLQSRSINKVFNRKLNLQSFKKQNDRAGPLKEVEEWFNSKEPRDPRVLVKPFLFTVVFCSGSLVTAKLLESSRLLKDQYDPEKWRPHNFNYKPFAVICALNVAVFTAWRYRPWHSTMFRYFLSSPASPTNCWPMVFSPFSHISSTHLITNMFVLYVFAPLCVDSLGQAQFYGFYLSSAVVSNFVSYAFRVVFNRPGVSLGASGAVMGVLGYTCAENPSSFVTFIFLPFFLIRASTLLSGVIVMDLIGLFNRTTMFDHAAHLGGSAFGVWWAKQGSSLLWLSDSNKYRKNNERSYDLYSD